MTINHPIFGSCRINEKGYPRINGGEKRDMYLHRAAFERVAGRAVRPGFHVHHMAGKLCSCPEQLVEIQACLHPRAGGLRCPLTGVYLSIDGWLRRFGTLPEWLR